MERPIYSKSISILIPKIILISLQGPGPLIYDKSVYCGLGRMERPIHTKFHIYAYHLL